MSHDEYHARWWRRQPISPSTHTYSPVDKQSVAMPTVGGGRWCSLRGWPCVPRKGVSSGLLFLVSGAHMAAHAS